MQLEYEKIECFKVNGYTFTCASKWNGLEEWRDQEGRQLIVARNAGDRFAQALAGTFGNAQAGKLVVVSGNPDLLMDLGEGVSA